MAAYKTWNIGDVLTASDMNTYVRDWGNNLVFVGLINGTQSVGPNGFVVVNWQAEIFDGAGVHSTTTNPERMTPDRPGYYYVNGFLQFSNSNTGTFRDIVVTLNGSNATFFGYSRTTSVLLTPNANSLAFTSVPVYCNGTTDFISVFASSDGDVAVTLTLGTVGMYRLRG